MAGYMTQTRYVPDMKHSYPAQWFTYGPTVFHDQTIPVDCTQVTTSYRTGRAEGNHNPENDEEIPTSSFAAIEQYRREYKEANSQWDNGHTFSTVKREAKFSHPDYTSTYAYYYHGLLRVDTRFHIDRAVDFPPDPGFIAQAYYGSAAINRTAPTNSATSLSVALAELKREGLPGLFGHQSLRDRALGPRQAGKEYLNVEFGWKPLVADIVSTMDAVSRSKQIIFQYLRDSGRVVRRKCTFPDIVTSSTTSQYALLENFPNLSDWTLQFYGRDYSGTLTTTRKSVTRTWFSGAYSYFVNIHDGLLGDLEKYEGYLNHLLGINLNPETLWALAPWSWLVDWNGSVGTVIANNSLLHTDGLVIRYGYLMQETTVTDTYTLVGPRRGDGTALGPIVSTYQTTSKRRIKANPYGFGSNPASYTDRQWTILGALGLTKAPKILG